MNNTPRVADGGRDLTKAVEGPVPVSIWEVEGGAEAPRFTHPMRPESGMR